MIAVATSPAVVLPQPLAPLVGRERDIAEVRALLDESEVRLVTLTGPGGVGKTRLALAVAGSLASDSGLSIAFVPLAPIRDPALVASAIASALEVRERRDCPLLTCLAAALRDRDMLLVLDNLEQVLPAATDLAALLAACPRMKVVVTSRTVLSVSGEHTIVVPPLPQSEAEVLYSTRARAADHRFVLTAENAPDVAAICERLDCLPLAIELAAARTRVLSPAALLARLTDRVQLLTGGPRDQPPRLRSMRDAIAWSHDLLDPTEQALFRRLAIFTGGFGLDAAEAVCADLEIDVLEGITALVQHSLVRRIEPAEAEPRFAMLETIREAGLQQLRASSGEEAMLRAHSTFFLDFVERIGPELQGSNEGRCLDRLEGELPNLRAALAWAEAHGEADTALRLAGALRWFWHMRGAPGEGRAWLERALAMHPATPTAARAHALDAAGLLAWHQGDNAQAAARADASLALGRELGEPKIIAGVLRTRGLVAVRLRRFDEGRVLHEEALALFRSLGDLFWIALSLLNLSASVQDDMGRRVALQQEALALFRDQGSPWGTARALTELGRTAISLRDLSGGIAYVREALALNWDRRDRWQLIFGLEILAEGVLAGGHPQRAARLLGMAAGLREATGVTAPLISNRSGDPVAVAARAQLAEQSFVAAWDEGRSRPLNQAIAEALAMAEEASTPQRRPVGALHRLTPRELDVLRLVVDGQTNPAIAERLYITERTARAHVAAILAKLGVPTRAAAASYALRHHLI